MTSRLAWGATPVGFAMWMTREAGKPPHEYVDAFVQWFWSPNAGGHAYEGVDQLVREFGLE